HFWILGLFAGDTVAVTVQFRGVTRRTDVEGSCTCRANCRAVLVVHGWRVLNYRSSRLLVELLLNRLRGRCVDRLTLLVDFLNIGLFHWLLSCWFSGRS